MSESKSFEHESRLGKYVHVENDEVYEVLSTEVISATDSSHGKTMVLYQDFHGMQLVKDYDEFFDGRFVKLRRG